MFKRRLVLLCSILAVLSILIAACTPQPSSGGSDAAPAAPAAGVAVAPAGEFPIVSEPITIKAFICPNSAVKDYNDNEYTRWLTELTNISLELDIPPVPDAQQKLNLMLASGDLPEVIIGCGIRLDQVQILANQGLLLPLNDYIDKYGVEFKKVYEAYPQI